MVVHRHVTKMRKSGTVRLTLEAGKQQVLTHVEEVSSLEKSINTVTYRSTGSRNCHLGGKRFADDEEFEMEMGKWLRQQSKDFYALGFDALTKRWDKRMNVRVG
jgi:hypothetical protein